METEPSIVLFNMFLAGSPRFNGLLFAFIIILIFLSAFFSMSETAFSTASETKLRLLIENKAKGSKKGLYLYEHYDKTLTTLLIGNNLVNVALSTIAVIFFTQLAIDENIVGLISTIVVTVVLLIFGEIIPKMIAKLYPETICSNVSWIVYIISFVFFPFVFMFTALQKLFNKHKDDANIEKEELEVIFKELKDSGEMEESEAEALQNVLDMKERSVEDIMVPRIKVSALNYDSTLEEVKNFMLDNPYSRIPVYKTDKDHIVGILYERDFFPALVKNSKMSWRKLIRPVKYVSKTMKTDNLIKELQISKTHLAVVLGEYGDTEGIVTMEDALEELVGEIYDEHDVIGENDIKFEQQEDGSYLVDAEIFVDDLFDKLNCGDIPDDVPSKLSGWILEKCEALPTVGYSFDYFASYTREDDEGEYADYNKIITIEIAGVENRAITLAKVAIRDATEEEIESYEED